MKYWMAILCTLAVLLVAGCSESSTGTDEGDNDDDQDTGMTGPGTISMTIAGAEWVSDVVLADTIRTGDIVISMGISGVRGLAAEAVGLGVGNVTGIEEGMYNYPSTSLSAIVFTFVNPLDTTQTLLLDPLASTGELNLTTLNYADGYVSGTFSFDVIRQIDGSTVEIREGVFNEIPFNSFGNATEPAARAAALLRR